MSTNRVQIVGLDKPSASALLDSSNEAKEIYRQAFRHEKNRLHSVAELMVLIGLLVKRGFLKGNEVVHVQGAHFQFGEGIRADQTVAAHCLPGHVAFNGLMLHHMVEWTEKSLRDGGFKPMPLAAKLRNLCGRCDVVDNQVNVVDSFLEKAYGRRGLKPGLARAVFRLLDGLSYQRLGKTNDLLPLVQKEFNLYQAEAGYLCLERQDWLSAKVAVSKDQIRRKTLKQIVLKAYLQVHFDKTFVPAALTMAGYELILKDVLAH